MRLFGGALIVWSLFLLEQINDGQPDWLDFAVPVTIVVATLAAGRWLMASTALSTPTIFKDKNEN